MTPTFKGNSEFLLTSISNGSDNRRVPFSLGLETREGSNLYNTIMSLTGFNEMVNKRLNRVREGAENDEYQQKVDKQFKEDVEGAKVKITIKIELEKYE